MKTKKKIYILTSGSYSDYQIEAVCSTRQLAKELKTANSWETDFEFDFEGNMYGYILAKNDEQAIKIINDKRVFLIANSQWKEK